MALIRALPDKYSSFVSSLMLLDDLKKETVHEAFRNYEITNTRRSDVSGPTSGTALSTSTSTSSSATKDGCEFCNARGHAQAKCFKYQCAMKEARKPKPKDSTSQTSGNTSTSANAANSAATASSVTEFAGNASLCSFHTSSPSLTHLWNADTGATSHMTPHRHWLKNYSPFHVPIRLADDTVVYSEGVGSVVFKPVIDVVKK